MIFINKINSNDFILMLKIHNFIINYYLTILTRKIFKELFHFESIKYCLKKKNNKFYFLLSNSYLWDVVKNVLKCT